MAQLGAQTLLAQKHQFQLVDGANAGTDTTAITAHNAAQAQFSGRPVDRLVHETPLAGKARSWNLAVHELIDPDAEIGLFLDADIEFIDDRSEEHTSELQSLMRISYAVFCLTNKKKNNTK